MRLFVVESTRRMVRSGLPGADLLNLVAFFFWRVKGKVGLRFGGLQVRLQVLARAGDGEAIGIKQFFYAQYIFYIPLPVEPLTGAAFFRRELGKLGLPKSQDVGGQLA